MQRRKTVSGGCWVIEDVSPRQGLWPFLCLLRGSSNFYFITEKTARVAFVFVRGDKRGVQNLLSQRPPTTCTVPQVHRTTSALAMQRVLKAEPSVFLVD